MAKQMQHSDTLYLYISKKRVITLVTNMHNNKRKKHERTYLAFLTLAEYFPRHASAAILFKMIIIDLATQASLAYTYLYLILSFMYVVLACTIFFHHSLVIRSLYIYHLPLLLHVWTIGGLTQSFCHILRQLQI